METVLLIDGDIIAYRTAAASEVRSIKVTHNSSGVEKSFKTRTEFKALLKAKDKLDTLERYTVEDVQIPSPISHCLHSINTTLRSLENAIFPDKTEIWLSGKDDNFRSKLLLPSEYKGSRATMLRPLLLNQAKEYLLDHHEGVRAVKIEADDVLSIRAFEEIAKGNKAVIVTNDKDTYQAEGVFIYDYTQDKPELFEVPVIGYLTKDGQKVKGAGLKFFAYQLLFGDASDDYKPCELANIRYGATSAYNDVKDLEFGDEILRKVISKYKEWYPEPFRYTAWNGTEVNANWETMLDLYFKCAYMKRSWNDPSDWRLFFAERGVV